MGFYFCFGFGFQLSFDLIEDWIKKNPKASICTPEGVEEFKNVAIFQDYHGFPEFRKVCVYIYIYCMDYD